MKHITETNVRAAETVKQEMHRERTSTFQQIKDFYKDNIRKIFETEVLGYVCLPPFLIKAIGKRMESGSFRGIQTVMLLAITQSQIC